MCTQLQVVLHHLGVTSTLFWCKLTRIPRLHNTVLVFFYPIQIRIVSGSHYCGVNVHHVGVTFTLNWCSHSCKNLYFFGVTITLALFLCNTRLFRRITRPFIPLLIFPFTLQRIVREITSDRHLVHSIKPLNGLCCL